MACFVGPPINGNLQRLRRAIDRDAAVERRAGGLLRLPQHRWLLPGIRARPVAGGRRSTAAPKREETVTSVFAQFPTRRHLLATGAFAASGMIFDNGAFAQELSPTRPAMTAMSRPCRRPRGRSSSRNRRGVAICASPALWDARSSFPVWCLRAPAARSRAVHPCIVLCDDIGRRWV
jgi:hypothetical protein